MSIKKLFTYLIYFTISSGILFLIISVYFFKIDFLYTAIIIIFYTIFNSANSIIRELQNASREREKYILSNLSAVIIRTLIGFILLSQISNKGSILAITYLLSSIIVFLYQYNYFNKLINLHKKVKINEQLKWTNTLLKYARPFWYWGIFGWLNQSLSRWSLQFFSNTSEVGIYGIYFVIGFGIPRLFLSTFENFLRPIIFETTDGLGKTKDTKKANRIIKDITLITILGSIFFTFILIFINPYIIDIILNDPYTSYSYLLPAFFFAGSIRGCTDILTLKIKADESPQKLIKPNILMNLISYIYTIILISSFGLEGGAASLILFSIINLIWKITIIIRP